MQLNRDPSKFLQHKIIGISGRAEAGKDTLAEYIQKKLQKDRRPCNIIHFADQLKNVLHTFFGISYELMNTKHGKMFVTDYQWENMPGVLSPDQIAKSADMLSISPEKMTRIVVDMGLIIKSGPMTVRDLLEYVGTDLFRKARPNCHIEALLSHIEQSYPSIFIIADVRAQNEVLSLLKLGGFNLRLTRNPHNRQTGIERDLDPDMFDWSKFDYVLDNADMSLEEKNKEGYKIINSLVLNEY